MRRVTRVLCGLRKEALYKATEEKINICKC